METITMDTQTEQLDPIALNLAKAIRQTETGGNYQARGKSGEFGAYQFTPNTWTRYASEFGINTPLEQANPTQQNEVAYRKIKQWSDMGRNVGQIASMWNAGEDKPDAYLQNYQGVNKSGIKYNVPQYAQSVATAYQTLKQGGQVGVDPKNPSSTSGTQVDRPYGAAFPAKANENVGDFALKTLGNVPTSALNLGKNIANTFLHPFKTLEGLGGAISGGVEKGMDTLGITQALGAQPVDTREKQQFSGLINGLKERYGGLDNIRRTAENDPVGLALDVSLLLQGGGALAQSVGRNVEELGDLSELSGAERASAIANATNEGALGGLAKAGQTAADIGSKINPINMAGKAIKFATQPLTKALDKVSGTATEAILKRTPSQVANNPELGSELADEGMMAFTRKGYLSQINERLGEVGDSIDEAISGKTGEISTNELVQKLQPLRDFYDNIPGEQSSVKAIDGIIDDTLAKGDTISIQDAQQLKTDIYKNLDAVYRQNKGILQLPAATGAQKALASGLRQQLEEQVPELSDLNHRYAILKGAKNAIEKTIYRATGKGIGGSGVGLYDLMTAIGGGAIGGFKGAAEFLGGEKLLTSTGVLSGTAKLLNLFDKVSVPDKVALYSAIAGELGKNTNTNTTNQLQPPTSVFAPPLMVNTAQAEQQAIQDITKEPNKPNIQVDEGSLQITLPSGKVYKFPDRQSLENFKAEVGL